MWWRLGISYISFISTVTTSCVYRSWTKLSLQSENSTFFSDEGTDKRYLSVYIKTRYFKWKRHFLERGLGLSQTLTPPSLTRLPPHPTFSPAKPLKSTPSTPEFQTDLHHALRIQFIYIHIQPAGWHCALYNFISFHLLISNEGPYGLLQVAYSDIHRHIDNIQLYIIRPRRFR